MKVAILHDYIGSIGGAEKTMLTLARGLGADIITTNLHPDAVNNMGFGDVNIISLGGAIKMPPLKQVSASLRFLNCGLSNDYDFFIFSGEWSHFAAQGHRPNLLYCHTPVRAFYDLYDTFLKRMPPVKRLAFRGWVSIHRPVYEYYMKYVDKILANSLNTRSRIKRYLHRDSQVIYPPIDVNKYKFKPSEDFWLCVNRLYPEKRVELSINAFKQMPEEHLAIVGGYAKGDHASEYAEKLRRDLPPNVEMLGEVGDDELIDLYARCKGYITTAVDEDFGMTPVEAMASGKPVIATREGGYLESVMDGETGILIEARSDRIAAAVRTLSENPEAYREACLRRAKAFDKSIFISGVDRVIKVLAENSNTDLKSKQV